MNNYAVRAVTLETLVTVNLFFGNQPCAQKPRDGQLAETVVFLNKKSEILKNSPKIQIGKISMYVFSIVLSNP